MHGGTVVECQERARVVVSVLHFLTGTIVKSECCVPVKRSNEYSSGKCW